MASLVILCGASILAVVAQYCVRQSRKRPASRLTFLASFFVAGALGTTFLSKWTGDFLFTWPVSVFIAIDRLVRSLKWKRDARVGRTAKFTDRDVSSSLRLFL